LITKFSGEGASWSSLNEFPRQWIVEEFDEGGYHREGGVQMEDSVQKIFGNSGEWKILCQIWVGNYISTTLVNASNLIARCSNEVRQLRLPNMLNELLVGGAYSDLDILVGGERIKAHKLILRGK